jgi:hypothetical protein
MALHANISLSSKTLPGTNPQAFMSKVPAERNFIYIKLIPDVMIYTIFALV